MGVTYSGEVPGTRRASEDENGNGIFTRVFQVETTSPHYGAIAVLSAIPVIRGDYYQVGNPGDDWFEVNENVFAINFEVECKTPDGLTWHITVEYKAVDQNMLTDDPISEPSVITWSSEFKEKIFDIDINGDPIVNSARDPYDPPVVGDDFRGVLIIERNEGAFDDTFPDTFQNKINSDVFYNRAAGTVKCRTIESVSRWHSSVGNYDRVRYEFQIEPDGWTRTVLNAGLRQLALDSSGNPSENYEHILDKGVPVSAPVPLGANGRALKQTGTPIWNDHEIYESIAFALMGLE